MFDTLFEVLVQPIVDYVSQYSIVIDGAEYLPIEVFAEVLAECLKLLLDLLTGIQNYFLVFCIGLLVFFVVIGAIFDLIDMIKEKRKSKKESPAAAVEI